MAFAYRPPEPPAQQEVSPFTGAVVSVFTFFFFFFWNNLQDTETSKHNREKAVIFPPNVKVAKMMFSHP